MASVKIAATANDGYAYADSASFFTNGIYLGRYPNISVHTWLRFILDVPQGATITAASIKFRANAPLLVTDCLVRVYGVDEDNHAAPTTYAEFTTDAGILTTAYVDWTIPAWAANSDYTSPDIAAVLQEIVDRPDFVQGNAVGIQVRNNGSTNGAYRTAYDYGASATYAAELAYTYTGTVDTNAKWNPDAIPGVFRLASDTATNDPHKTLTVPDGAVWDVQHVYCVYAADATVGNRRVILQVRNATNDVIAQYPAVAVQTAGTSEFYTWVGTHDPVETVATYHLLPLVPHILPPGYDLFIYDSGNISAGDDTVIHALVVEYPA